MKKLVLALGKALDKEGTALTHFSKFIKGRAKNENWKHKCYGVQLKHYKGCLHSVNDHYLITVSNICESAETHF